MRTKDAGCSGCHYEQTGKSYVPGSGNPQAKVIILQDNPTRAEAYSGEPLSHASGQRFDLWLAKANLPHSKLWLDCGMRCWYTQRGRDVAPRRALEECRERHILPMLYALEPEWLVCMGVGVSKLYIGPWCGTRAAGSVVEVEL